MSVWPEERLRERLESAGEPLEIDDFELLGEFGARRPTARARADAAAALAEEGVGVRPRGWADNGGGRVTLFLLDREPVVEPAPAPSPPPPPPPPPAPSRTVPPPPPITTAEERIALEEKLAALYEAREAAAVTYCGRICAPARVLSAVEAAFSAVAEEAGAHDTPEQLDDALREKLRGAAARRAPALRSHAKPHGVPRGTTACEQVHMMLAARAGGHLTEAEEQLVEDQLRRCDGCGDVAARFHAAEHAYALMCDAEPLAAMRRRLLEGVGPARPEAGPPPGRWEGTWVEDGDEPRVGLRRVAAAATASGHGQPSAERLPRLVYPRPASPRPVLETALRGARPLALAAVGFVLAGLGSWLLLDDAPDRPNRPQPAATARVTPLAALSPDDRRVAKLADAHNSAARTGDPVGRLSVPRLKIGRVLVQGAQPSVVTAAPGHDPKTSLPGGQGPVAFLGHRRTGAGPLGFVDRLRTGDRLELDLPYGRFTYSVGAAGVIRAGDVLDLRSLRRGDLVLGAGDPPVRRVQRVLIHARLVAARGRSR